MKFEIRDINFKFFLILLALYPGFTFIFEFNKQLYGSADWWKYLMLSYSYTLVYTLMVIPIILAPYIWKLLWLNRGMHKQQVRVAKLYQGKLPRGTKKRLNSISKEQKEMMRKFLKIIRQMLNTTSIILVPTSIFIVATSHTAVLIMYIISGHTFTGLSFSVRSLIIDGTLAVVFVFFVPNYPDLIQEIDLVTKRDKDIINELEKDTSNKNK